MTGSNVIPTERELLTAAKAEGIVRVLVGALVFRHGELLLLIRASTEDFLPGLVELPSGHVDPGESLEEGLQRELLEETGLPLQSVDRYAGAFDYLTRSGKKARQFNYVVTVSHLDVRLNPSEHQSYLWATPGTVDFERLNMSRETRSIVNAFGR